MSKPNEFIEPCLATTASSPPPGPQWLHEIKLDGYRLQAHIRGGSVTFYTRTGLDWTDKFGVVSAEFGELSIDHAILDCEAIVQDERGVSDFHALQREIKLGGHARIAIVAFDLLLLSDVDWRPRPLLERKARLKRLLGVRATESLLRYGDHIIGDADAIFEQTCELGLEGIVSKRTDRPYQSGRTGDWIKVKCLLDDDLVVIGYVDQKSKTESIGSLVLGYWEGPALVYAGRVGTGFSTSEAHAIWQALQTVRTTPPPLAARLLREQREGVKWVEPRLVVEVHHRGWTHDRVLRHSAFKTFRYDKDARDIAPPASLRSSDK